MGKNDIFYMEIFNEIIKINDNELIIIYDIYNNIWFKFKDLLKILGYTGTLK
jgi:prophage antirepressor-like protein